MQAEINQYSQKKTDINFNKSMEVNFDLLKDGKNSNIVGNSALTNDNINKEISTANQNNRSKNELVW